MAKADTSMVTHEFVLLGGKPHVWIKTSSGRVLRSLHSRIGQSGRLRVSQAVADQLIADGCAPELLEVTADA